MERDVTEVPYKRVEVRPGHWIVYAQTGRYGYNAESAERMRLSPALTYDQWASLTSEQRLKISDLGIRRRQKAVVSDYKKRQAARQAAKGERQ